MKKSIVAGILIALGGIAFLSVENKIIGSLLFSIGLLSVLIFNFDLYTGKVCNVDYYRNPVKLFIVWNGNFIGSAAMGLLMRSHADLVQRCSSIMISKIEKNILSTCIDSIICGICIAIAVKGYAKAEEFGKHLMVVLGVMVFILTDAEHCIADIFYAFLAQSTPFYDTVVFLFIVTFFNTVGGFLTIIALNNSKLKGH